MKTKYYMMVLSMDGLIQLCGSGLKIAGELNMADLLLDDIGAKRPVCYGGWDWGYDKRGFKEIAMMSCLLYTTKESSFRDFYSPYFMSWMQGRWL